MNVESIENVEFLSASGFLSGHPALRTVHPIKESSDCLQALLRLPHCGPGPSTLCPLRSTMPSSYSASPDIIRSSVLFPQPLCPTIVTNSPSLISSDISFNTSTGFLSTMYCLFKCSIRIIACFLSLFPSPFFCVLHFLLLLYGLYELISYFFQSNL